MCAKVGQQPVLNCLLKVKYDKYGLPINLEHDEETDLFYGQFDADDFKTSVENVDVVVSGVKVNVYLRLSDRLPKMNLIRKAIEEEERYLKTIASGAEKIPDLKALRAKLKYHKVTIDSGKFLFTPT